MGRSKVKVKDKSKSCFQLGEADVECPMHIHNGHGEGDQHEDYDIRYICGMSYLIFPLHLQLALWMIS